MVRPCLPDTDPGDRSRRCCRDNPARGLGRCGGWIVPREYLNGTRHGRLQLVADQPPEIQECRDWAVGPGTTDYSTTLGLIDLIWDRLDFLLRDTPLFFAGYNCLCIYLFKFDFIMLY